MRKALGHQRVAAFFAGALTASVAVADSVQTTSAGGDKLAHASKRAQPINLGCSDVLPKYDKATQYNIGQGALSTVLHAAGLSAGQKEIVQALSDAGLNSDRAKATDRVYITWDGKDANKSLKSLVYRPDSLGDYVLTQAQGGGYEATYQELCMYESRHSASFQVRAGQTLSKVMKGASISRAGVSALVATFADKTNLNDVDVGDAFKVLYTKHSSKDGSVVRFGRFLYAEVDRGGDGRNVFARHYFNGQYYTPQGQEVKVSLMAEPLENKPVRRSSPFGERRKHPVDDVYRAHNGTDYAAPVGANIVAAGNGVVTVQGDMHEFRGNYIEIAHGNECVSRYFHMHSFADGVTQGSTVKTGDVIGTVGDTGKVTGAHLHYAVECHGVYQNPESMSLPMGAELAGDALEAFKAQRAEHLAQYNGQQPDPQSALDAHQMANVPK